MQAEIGDGMIRLFIGSDEDEAIGLYAFLRSVWKHASVPVAACPIQGDRRDGSNLFIYERFLVPYHCSYNGWAIWADGTDMLCRADIAELAALYDPTMAVQVVKHDYQTKFKRKYYGQKNEDYPRKNWSSLMLINCAHFAWRQINPVSIKARTGAYLHRFDFIDDRYIGALPVEWNWLVQEMPYNRDAKIAHFTIGLPCYYPEGDYTGEWLMRVLDVNDFKPWDR